MITALFAGSFDPPTLGHYNIIERASKLCNRLVIGVANNPDKKPCFSLTQRLQLLHTITLQLPHVTIQEIEGLTADFARENQIQFLIRGLRSPEDLSMEQNLALINKKMSGIETVFFLADPLYQHIHAKVIKEVVLDGKSLEAFLPQSITKEVIQHLLK